MPRREAAERAEPRVRKVRGLDEETAKMAEQVRVSLTAPQPWLSSKYFYDDRGSELFEAITRLPEYYQTRTEEKLLERIAGQVVSRVAARELVEVGSGAGRKIRVLLEQMRSAGRLERCALLDINEAFLVRSVERLSREFPEAAFRGVVGDFLGDLGVLGPGGERLVIFLGGTVGNLDRLQVTRFFGQVARQLRPGDGLLVGVDLVKAPARLHAAYNDAAGVTAEFNRNILCAVNHRLDGNFEPAAFEHVAFYDRERERIEMRLRATRSCSVRLEQADLDLAFDAGDEIRTEISCKYTRDSLVERLHGTGLVLDRWYVDDDDLFGLALLRPATLR